MMAIGNDTGHPEEAASHLLVVTSQSLRPGHCQLCRGRDKRVRGNEIGDRISLCFVPLQPYSPLRPTVDG